MNKNTRTALIVALSVFGAGVVICFCVAMSLHFDLTKLTHDFRSSASNAASTKTEHIDKDIEEKGQNIVFDLSSANVTVTPSSDNMIHLSYDNSDYCSFTLDDGAAQLKLKQDEQENAFFSVHDISPEVTLSIPTEHEGSMNINGASSRISISNVEISGDLEINSVSGKIMIKNCKSKTLKSGNTSGEIELESLEVESLRANTVSGALRVSEISQSIPMTLASTSGEVYAENVKTENLGVETISGGITLKSVAGQKAELSTTSGGVNIGSVDFGEIDFKSISGGIRGTVSGSSDDYTVYTDTVSGSNSLSSHRGRGNKTLDLSSVSGGIDISFEK